MKGYLKSSDGIFQLAPKVTTVGREGCDLVVQNVHVDFQHSVIEYSEAEDCYVLQDLNTAQGTYVNECRVQNAAVRLAPGDVIRFGYGGAPYELVLEQSSQLAYPPVHQRPAWTQPLTVISDPLPPQVIMQEPLPHLRQVVATTTSTWDNNGSSRLPHAQQQPRPPPMATTIRSRPLSAGAIRNNRTHSQPTAQQHVREGWVQNGRRNLTSSHSNQQVDILTLQEKHQTPFVYNGTEQRILRLQDEIKRLQVYEQECYRKDDLTQTLRQEVTDLQVKVRRFETSQQHTDPELTQRLMQLENEVQQKRQEVQGLKDQLNRARSESRPSSTGSRQDMNDRVMEINSLTTELERVRKDKNITAGLVTQMQRDMANKDTSISRLTAELTQAKKDISERELQIQQLHTKSTQKGPKWAFPEAKWHKSPESRQRSDDLENKDKEAAQLRVTIKQLESKSAEHSTVIEQLKIELEKQEKIAEEATKDQTRLQKELDTCKSKLQDLERAERLVRVDLEQGSKRMERFRNRVVQVTFSTPGIKAPEKEITDDELLETLKQIIDQRTEMQREIGELKETLAGTDKGRKEITDSSKKLKDQLNQAVDPKKK